MNVMNELLAHLAHHLQRHMEGYGVGSGAFMLAAARSMIKPGVRWSRASIYKWFYDTVQSVLPGSHREPDPPNPTPPADPAEPQK